MHLHSHSPHPLVDRSGDGKCSVSVDQFLSTDATSRKKEHKAALVSYATAVKHAKKIETKNENVSSEKPVFGLKKRCRRVVGKWTKSPKKLNGSPS